MTPYQKQTLDDIGARDGYGTPLAGWRDQQPFFTSGSYKGPLTSLPSDLAGTFVERVYFLLKTHRVISIYRGYETAGLKAPYGREHVSFIQNLVSLRRPGLPDGLWWTPMRPSMAIDNLKLSALHRAEHQSTSAIKREWNRLDYYLEYALPVGTMIYVGRSAPQQEDAAYGGTRYGGGAFQFRLTQSLTHAIPQMKTHAVL